ncbi:MAG: hypothetical protein ABW090_08090 [Sedimenticola sp.]
MTRLQLTVPTTAPVENPNVITSPRQLAEWVEDLPYANPQVTAKMLLDSLQQLVRQPGTLSQFHRLMINYLPPFRTLQNAVAKSAQRQHSVTGHRREAELAELFEQINKEMAHGFKRAILDGNFAASSRHSDNEVAETLYHAIECLSLDLVFSYSRYSQASANVWREILQIYLLAEHRGVSQTSVETIDCADEVNTDIRLIFKRILLITLLDPYRLQQGDIWACFNYLTCWAQHAQLSNFKARQKASSCFLVDLQGAQKATPYDPEEPPAEASRFLMLDIYPLNKEINQQLKVMQNPPASASSDKRSGMVSEHLMRTMLLAWYVKPKRRHQREERYDWLVSAWGIAAIQHFLLEGKLVSAGKAHSELDPYDQETIEIGDVKQDPLTASRFDTHRWRQVNMSDGGVGMVMNPADACGLQVGQIVLLESERMEGEGKSMVGIVRRLLQRDKSTLEAGIQFVHGIIHPATIRPEVFGTEESADRQPALLLNTRAHPNVLLAPHLIYRKGRQYVVEDHAGRTMKVTADNLQESTLCFDRFEYLTVQLHG